MSPERKVFKATREAFGEILELGKKNKNVYVIDADIGKSCKTGAFREALNKAGMMCKFFLLCRN